MSRGKSITIVGIKETRKALEQFGAEVVAMFDNEAETWAKMVVAVELSGRTHYPPPRPQQRYVRTFKLAESWRASRVRTGRWRIYNTQPYAPYVVGNAGGTGQAKIHRGRWWRAIDKVNKHHPQLIGRTEKRFVSRWNELAPGRLAWR